MPLPTCPQPSTTTIKKNPTHPPGLKTEDTRGETPVLRWLDAQRDSPALRSRETPGPTNLMRRRPNSTGAISARRGHWTTALFPLVW
jgi:hypothetical protein